VNRESSIRIEAAKAPTMTITSAQNSARKRAAGRPTREQASELHETVLRAALHAFMKRGYEGASIEGIAREAKVAKITLYRQFGGKERLFFEVTRYAQAGLKRSLEVVVDTAAPPRQVLRSMILRMHEGHTHPDYLAVLRLVVAESQRFPKIAEAMLHDSDYVLEPVIRYLSERQKEGLITLDNPRDGALQLSCLALGGTRYLMIKPRSTPQSRAHWADALTTLFARAWQLDGVPTKTAKPSRKRKGSARSHAAAASPRDSARTD
jgi:AcrR family transcriptional regulator